MIHSEEARLERGEGVVSVDCPSKVDIVTKFNFFVSNEFFMELRRYGRKADEPDKVNIIKNSYQEAPDSTCQEDPLDPFILFSLEGITFFSKVYFDSWSDSGEGTSTTPCKVS